MLKLQAKGVESVAWEERILTRAGRSGVTALATASGLDELRRKRDAFTALPSVSQVESVLMLVPDGQPEKAKVIEQLAPIVAPVRVARAPALAPAELRAPLETLRRRLRLATEEGGEQARQEVQPVLAKIEGLLASCPAPPSAGPGRRSSSSRARSRATSPTSSRPSRRTFPRGPSCQATRPRSFATATSDRAGATCCASSPPSTSGSGRGRSAS